jgi:hypothetical protein
VRWPDSSSTRVYNGHDVRCIDKVRVGGLGNQAMGLVAQIQRGIESGHGAPLRWGWRPDLTPHCSSWSSCGGRTDPVKCGECGLVGSGQGVKVFLRRGDAAVTPAFLHY